MTTSYDIKHLVIAGPGGGSHVISAMYSEHLKTPYIEWCINENNEINILSTDPKYRVVEFLADALHKEDYVLPKLDFLMSHKIPCEVLDEGYSVENTLIVHPYEHGWFQTLLQYLKITTSFIPVAFSGPMLLFPTFKLLIDRGLSKEEVVSEILKSLEFMDKHGQTSRTADVVYQSYLRDMCFEDAHNYHTRQTVLSSIHWNKKRTNNKKFYEDLEKYRSKLGNVEIHNYDDLYFKGKLISMFPESSDTLKLYSLKNLNMVREFLEPLELDDEAMETVNWMLDQIDEWEELTLTTY